MSGIGGQNAGSNSPFLSLSDQPNVRLANSATLGRARVLRPVKHEHLTGNGLGSNQVRVLGHVSCTIDLSRMVDLLYNLQAGLRGDCMTAELTPVIIVVAPVKPVRRTRVVALRKMNGGNLKIVLGLSGRVCSKKQSVDSVWLVRWSAAGLRRTKMNM